MILPGVSPTATKGKTANNLKLSIYTKGIQSNLAIEDCLNAQFISFVTGTQYVLDIKIAEFQMCLIDSLSYAAYL